jgi:TRAP-type C4-dicarboxylate transport system permease small subunit
MLYVATAALLLMTSLVVISSFMRYLVGRPFGFTEELVALLYMSMVFLAIPIATVHRRHVAITVLPQKIMLLFKRPFRFLAVVAMIAFCIWFTVAAVSFTSESYRFGSRTEISEILLWPWMAVIPISMGLVSLISILHLIQGADPSEGPGESGEAVPGGDTL